MILPPASKCILALSSARWRRIMPRIKKKKVSVQAQIDRMVKRIVKKFHPEKIILFGSQTRGDAGPDSDVDVLVVMDFEGSKLDKMVDLQGAADDSAVPVDILVTTPEDFAWRKDVVGTIELTSLNKRSRNSVDHPVDIPVRCRRVRGTEPGLALGKPAAVAAVPYGFGLELGEPVPPEVERHAHHP